MECPGGSIDRLQFWRGHANVAEATTVDASILVKQGNRSIAKATFTGSGDAYTEVTVLLANDMDAGIDLSHSSGFEMTYSSTADFFVELRGTVLLHTGDQYAVKMPATGGKMVTRFVSFDPANWMSIFDKPPVTFAQVIRTANMFDIVGNTANTAVFYGVRFDGYIPACK